MRCPQDVDVELVMTERQGVEIDYCPTCRGVWLDRGELDKILDRAAAQAPGPEAGAPRSAGPVLEPGRPSAGGYGVGGYPPAGAYGDDDRRDDRGLRRDDRGRDDLRRYDERSRYGEDRPRYDDDRERHERGRDPRRKRKESWLGDLLDFG